MLNVFPSLLSFSLIAPLIIRLAIGAIAIYFAYKQLRNRGDTPSKQYVLSSLTLVCGILIIIGLFTQLAAVALSVISIIGFLKTEWSAISTKRSALDILFIVATLSLIFSGAGFLAFDLPL